MSNRNKYNSAFIEALEISEKDLTEALDLSEDMEYQGIKAWDSVGHMALMAAIEDEFDITFEMDDIVDFSSYNVGIETLKKYGVEI